MSDPTQTRELKNVVAIGSSAGGLTALQELVAECALGSGSAYVIAQHLSPDRTSLVVELLQLRTSLPVLTATDGQVLEPDTITVIPPNSNLLVDASTLRLLDASGERGPSPSIDRLFESLASSWGNRAVGIVLSGTGNDGSQGLRVLKEAEALTIAQEPSTAKFDAMPRAAILTGGVDLILSPTEIGSYLLNLATQGDWLLMKPDVSQVDHLTTAVSQLRRVTGIDFSGYKTSTLRRQIQRRMAIRQFSAVEDYLAILSAEDDEVQALQHNLLVTVTSFFRDPEVFDALEAHLATYVQTHTAPDPIRVWVPGCATGEEVYSIAMLIGAALGFPADLSNYVRIFGTDLDEGSLAIARRGHYPSSAADRIPEHLRGHYLTDTHTGVEMSRNIRECIVFARHNVITDPPFPRLDLVSCRNTLIYFTTALQERVLGTLRYSLVPGGLLLLGLSETLGKVSSGFDVTESELRLFTRTTEPMPAVAPSLAPLAWQLPKSVTPQSSSHSPSLSSPPSGMSPTDRRSLVSDSLLALFAPPSLVVNADNSLIEVVGDVSEFCRLPAGVPPRAAGDYLRPEFQAEVRALLLIARAENQSVIGNPITMSDLSRTVTVQVRPIPDIDSEVFVVSFLSDDHDPELAPVLTGRDPALDVELERLERQLAANQESLHRSMAELESANEELQASSEELQASSEELQSSYEELETTNEELRATNDQLTNSNEELHERSEQLHGVNRDLEAILASLNQGIILVDRDLLVLRFSAMAVRLFALVPDDIGRSLLTVPTTMPVPSLGEALLDALAGRESRSWEVSGDSGAFLIRVLLHHGDSERSRGVIITFTDVTDIVQARETQEAVFNTSLEPHVLLKPIRGESGEIIDFEYFDANEVAAKAMRTERSELIGSTITETYPKPADTSAIAMFADIMKSDEPTVLDNWSYPHRVLGEVRYYDIRAVRTGDLLSFAWRDVTERHQLDKALADRELEYRLIAENTADVVVVVRNGAVEWVSPSVTRTLGGEAEDWIGVRVDDYIHPDDFSRLEESIAALKENEVSIDRYRIRTHDGLYHWIEVHSKSYIDESGERDGFIASIHIVDREVFVENELERRARIDPVTGILNRHEIFERLEKMSLRTERSGKCDALLFCDIDDFKGVNDSYGHEVGDAVLRTIAERIQVNIRSNDFVARLGGDEFLVFLEGVQDSENAMKIAESIRRAVSKPIALLDGTSTSTVSIGVILTTSGITVNDLIASADDAMYQAKQEGKNQVRLITGDE